MQLAKTTSLVDDAAGEKADPPIRLPQQAFKKCSTPRSVYKVKQLFIIGYIFSHLVRSFVQQKHKVGS
jgi:hypothetical protein